MKLRCRICLGLVTNPLSYSEYYYHLIDRSLLSYTYLHGTDAVVEHFHREVCRLYDDKLTRSQIYASTD